ncbi:MAG: spiroplasma phage ORF1-like family protein [Spiroplasma sp.]
MRKIFLIQYFLKVNFLKIANNGFKIYSQYFYYSDRYNSLKVDLYSSYNNWFYKQNMDKLLILIIQ